MAGHAYINQVQDPNAQKALLDLQGQVKALVTRVQLLETNALQTTATAGISAQGQRLTNVASPTADTDAVNVSYLRAYVAAQGAF